jgi:hypothetical protein
LLFSDDGTAGTYPYTNIDISYTSQLLYNQVLVNSNDGITSRNLTSPSSIDAYNISQLNVDGVLYNNATRCDNLGTYLISKYSEPEYRINSLRVNYGGLSTAMQDAFAVKTTELNYYCKVRFTPNGVGTPVERFVRVIGMSHDITPGSHEITFMFESIRTPNLVLDDAEFGKLDTYLLGL